MIELDNCRKCTECENTSHHWMENTLPWYEGDEYDSAFICKHCTAVGMRCPCCDGDGVDRELGPDDCRECKGEGAVFMHYHRGPSLRD